MIGDTIRMLRDARGMTPEQLAEAVGISLQAVENYEGNIWRPGAKIIEKMAKYLCVTTQEIMNGYSLLYDDERCEILVVRNMGGNRIRMIGRITDNGFKMKQKGC
ncbi:hypothetical protein P22_1294 [Propionispora sp. 2/2-37]|uniref:helix-turn-helix domain-containing protein n=1 Tax=Propionispora sp. 2/2-37 TaxID=1677858 RepID=UPI0006BB70E7|nr:helix-turn-helix transcriptional regulator [Propionispora sp. 2/2-37]CUH95224.1 hypothetical protein P22_1294 [Propionispora sp. 2/2-37]